MNFAERPPSTQWAALMFRGQQFAEVWFKPEGNPFALKFRIPQSSFQIPGLDQRLTCENLLKAVGVATEEVESWHEEGETDSSTSESTLQTGGGRGGNLGEVPPLEMGQPLSPPPQDVTHLNLRVSLKQPSPQTVTSNESGTSEIQNESSASEIPEATWQFLENRWTDILGLEASVESLRNSMEGLRSEMEAETRKMLPVDAKVHALSSDVVQWNKAKNRIRYAVPKVREAIHRSTWATATPERKKFAELFENHIKPRIPFPQLDEVLVQFEGLLKDRQNLYAQGMSVYQECKNICADCQNVLRTLQSNAAANASRKKHAKNDRR